MSHTAEIDALVALLSEHYPHPVFGCECTPEDEASGVKESLEVSWERHVADLIARVIPPEVGDEA